MLPSLAHLLFSCSFPLFHYFVLCLRCFVFLSFTFPYFSQFSTCFSFFPSYLLFLLLLLEPYFDKLSALAGEFMAQGRALFYTFPTKKM